LNPTAYVDVVLARVGEGVTVTPVTDVPKVIVPISVSPANGTWVVVPGVVYCGTIVTGYVKAAEGLRPSALSVMLEPAGIPEPRRTVTTLFVFVPTTPVVLTVADETVAVVKDPPEGV
jgi:hypothetical protein